MKDKVFYLGAAFFLMLQGTGWTAPPPFPGGRLQPPSYAGSPPPPPRPMSVPSQSRPVEDPGTLLRQLKIGLTDLKHEVGNHELELRMFEDKLRNQESSYEQLSEQISNNLQTQKDQFKASTIHQEGRIDHLDQAMKNFESTVKGIMADLRQIKTQANDSVAVLEQYKQKLSDLEHIIDAQNRHMQNLEVALQSMIDVIQVKETNQDLALQGSNGFRIYVVQPGDSLEKIAKNQKISVQALRNVNQLTKDRIIVGQKLKIPE